MRVRNDRLVAFTAVMALASPAAAQDTERVREPHVWILARADARLAQQQQVEPSREAQRRREATRQSDEERQREAIARARQQRDATTQQRQVIAARGRQMQQGWAEIAETWTRTVPLGPNGTFDLENLNGDVVITGGRGGVVKIDALRKMRNPSEAQARRLLEQVQIVVIERGGNVDVRTHYPRVRNTAGEVTYTVAVPATANVTVRTMSGDVRVTNVNGELRAEAVSGDVVASDVRRLRAVKTMTGNIQLTNGVSDELTASTMSGNVTLNNMKGRLFDLQSVTGNVRLTNVEPDRANLRSMNGDIDYVGRLARSGRYDFQSHGGSIRVTPTTNQGFDIQATTLTGHFHSDYALKITEDSAAGPRRTGSRVLRATFGDASAAILAHSFGGDIVLIRR